MTSRERPGEQIIAEVGSWPGVQVSPGNRGELSFRVGRKEIGHLHGDAAAHFGFPRPIWTALLQQGRIVPHPYFPHREGLAARRIRTPEDVWEVIELMRINYQRFTVREQRAEDGARGSGEGGSQEGRNAVEAGEEAPGSKSLPASALAALEISASYADRRS